MADYIPIIIVKGKSTISLKLVNLETYNVGRTTIIITSDSEVSRDGVFGGVGDANIQMSYTEADIRYNKFKTKNSSFSPVIIPGDITVSIEEEDRILSSEVKLSDWFESDSEGLITTNIIPNQSIDTLLSNYNIGDNRLRPLKVFLKNTSGRDLSFIHIGIDYPQLSIDNLNLLNTGTDIDTYEDAEEYSGWVYGGTLKTNITQGGRLVDYSISVDFGTFEDSLLWVGQLLRLYNGKTTMYVVISEITGVTEGIVQLKVFSENDVLDDFNKNITTISGIKTIANAQQNEIIPIWLFNVIPSNSTNTQKKIRIWASGVR